MGSEGGDGLERMGRGGVWRVGRGAFGSKWSRVGRGIRRRASGQLLRLQHNNAEELAHLALDVRRELGVAIVSLSDFGAGRGIRFDE